jgi:hypothetical protein
MKATEGKIGRVFIVRLEDGDVLPKCIEKFAADNKICVGQVIMLGGIGSDRWSSARGGLMKCRRMRVVPRNGRKKLSARVRFPDENGKPEVICMLRWAGGKTTTVCQKPGVRHVWSGKCLSTRNWARQRFVLWMKNQVSSCWMYKLGKINNLLPDLFLCWI